MDQIFPCLEIAGTYKKLCFLDCKIIDILKLLFEIKAKICNGKIEKNNQNENRFLVARKKLKKSTKFPQFMAAKKNSLQNRVTHIFYTYVPVDHSQPPFF